MESNKNLYVIVGLSIYCLLMTIVGVDKYEELQSKEIELQRERVAIRRVRDSAETVIKRKDVELLKSIREGAEKDLIAQEKEKLAKKLIHEIRTIKRIDTKSDHERDSLLRSVLD